ncbi:MAG: DegQ family serine endoprotease [Conchiformibius sp.]|nr:DegQ family serine endoprotease [Conchiformibius sp.]
MNTYKTLKHLVLFSVLVLGIAACGKNEKTAKEPKAASQTVTEFITPIEREDGGVGMLLPDFASLVAQEGSTVVNIQALTGDKPTHILSEPDSAAPGSNDPFEEFFRRLIPNTPDIAEQEDYDANFGSGVIISSDGYILTNAHVIKNLGKIKVTLNDKREYDAKLVGADEKSDIALLKINANNLPAAKIGNPDELKSGEWVAAIGAPFGFENSVTAGIVSAKGRSLPNESYTPFIQTDVAINMGNSGGPLFNLKGQVVGINSQIYSRSGGFMGISFAIPIDVAMNVAEQLKNTGKVQRGQLGVIIQEVSYDLAQSFGLDKPTGALIAKVIADSPAEKAGLRVGDIIRSVNGETIRSSSQLPMSIGSVAPGKEVILEIWRQGKETQAKVILGALDDNNAVLSDNVSPPPHSGSVGSFEVKEIGLHLNINTDNGNQELWVQQASGPAAAAGLKRGDIIRQINGMAVRDQAGLTAALKQAGKNIPVLVQRGNSSIFMALVLP